MLFNRIRSFLILLCPAVFHNVYGKIKATTKVRTFRVRSAGVCSVGLKQILKDMGYQMELQTETRRVAIPDQYSSNLR
ncbi:hypothetical protein GWI33_017898 [Rhynchophorus ferrugineus]|uniref:HMA domain-containing protein n=1 Tax=Rhynchophorus ferrugineus TaxID=354439 RepID=A0A834M209_RHYFE|nr:hypothetical protein GWI33_017898 [Rhynchophorus ferrugineus]